MIASVEITDTSTGIAATYQDEDYDEYMWTDGNYGCDCNRFLFHSRALGKDPNWDEGECGSERFKIRVMDGAGVVIYAEKDD